MCQKAAIVVLVLLTLSCSTNGPMGQQSKETPGRKDLTNSIGMKLVLIPAGEFMMGNGHTPEEEVAVFKPYPVNLREDAFKDEYPQHRVRITRAYYLGACHVTRGQFRKFIEDTGYKVTSEKKLTPGASGWDPKLASFRFDEKFSWRDVGFEQTDEHPVFCVSWDDAVAFCQWLSQKEGKTYRLPTEAEWEYACRAGSTTRYWFGEDPEGLAKAGNMSDGTGRAKYPTWLASIKAEDGHIFTAPVGSFAPNAFGLYDMHGNGWQWCADWYDEKFYSQSPADDPRGPATGKEHVIRGGSWNTRPGFGRSADRSKLRPEFNSVDGTSSRVVREE